jgi:hypothetical protein
MSDYITDPAVLEKIGKTQSVTEVKKDEYVTDPAVLQQLGGGTSDGGEQITVDDFGAEQIAQSLAPAGMGSGPTGVRQLSREIGGAVSPYAKGAVSAATSGYKARPLMTAAVDAIGLGTVGAPVASAYNSAMGMADQFGRAKGAAQGVSKVLSQSSLIQSPVTNMPYPESVPAFREMQKIAPEISAKLSEVYQKGGGNNAVKAFLASPEAAQYMKDPRFAAAAEAYMGKVPGMGAQAMKVAGPLLRGAARVAGPVGLGMNIYDASQMAQETQLGSRLAQGQGRQAQQAFRGRNQNYGPVSPDQAQAVMQSGSERDIAAFGGRDKLSEMIRLKAAEKVLGPVAPGQ